MTMIKILPCPFCGGRAVVSTRCSSQTRGGIVAQFKDSTYEIHCTDCPARMSMAASKRTSTDDLAEWWNQRMPLDDLESVRRVAGLKHQVDRVRGAADALETAIEVAEAAMEAKRRERRSQAVLD